MRKSLIVFGIGYLVMIPVGGPIWPATLTKWALEYRASSPRVLARRGVI